ncbi:hypothetical protein G4B88_022253 [Cannabis sativa]|uniref:Uncharacterized protein n=1 Tax=Cannabis sativa TaxID=3483 RepID=A0A7J6DKY4_CANSA|nr:hypothetical protein G4B88_022253 [Cannabis sativa]
MWKSLAVTNGASVGESEIAEGEPEGESEIDDGDEAGTSAATGEGDGGDVTSVDGVGAVAGVVAVTDGAGAAVVVGD